MIYSVWNQPAKRYDYYGLGGNGEAEANVPPPSHLRAGVLGAAPDQASWPLPAGVRKVGSGDHPVGRIASPNGGSALGAVGGDMGLLKIGMLGLCAYLLWKHVVK